jgi:hypothetical protein
LCDDDVWLAVEMAEGSGEGAALHCSSTWTVESELIHSPLFSSTWTVESELIHSPLFTL